MSGFTTIDELYQLLLTHIKMSWKWKLEQKLYIDKMYNFELS